MVLLVKVYLYIYISIFVIFLSRLSEGNFVCHTGCVCSQNDTIVFCHGLNSLEVKFLPSRTRKLSITNGFLGPIFNQSLSTLVELEYIDLTNNNIKELKSNTFQHLRMLKWLSLHNNKLRHLEDYQFQFTDSLEYLDLSGNHFSVLPDVPFRFLTNLKVLNFSFNQLTSPQLGLRFQTMTDLHILDFTRNKFDWIPSDVFAMARNWNDDTDKAINLSFCGIRGIGDGAFSYPVGLKSLSLRGNFEITAQNLTSALNTSNLVGLRILNLSEMNLTEISSVLLAIRDVPLMELYISKNKLREIPNALSDFQRNLQVLDAHQNRIISLGSSVTQISSLRYLDFSYNEVSAVDEMFGQNLINLRYLSVAHNKIRNNLINVENMTPLFTLDVSFNKLTEFTVPSSLTNLQILNMAGNRIDEITKFLGLSSLRHLDVSGNKITQLESFLFPDSYNIMFANFSGNSISVTSHQSLRPNTPKIIDLSQNKLTSITNLGWEKASEIYLQGNQISEMDRQTFYPLYSLKKLDLSRNRLTNFPSASFVYLLNLTNLDMHHNQLTDHEGLQIACSALENLEYIDLGFNNYSFFLPKTFRKSKRLRSLKLNNNHVATIDPHLFYDLHELEVIDLSDNTFNCNCDLIDFRNWLRHTKLKIIERTNTSYMCRGPPIRSKTWITNFKEGQFECRKTLLYIIIFMSTGTLLMIVGIISTIVCQKYLKWKKNWKAAHESIHYEEVDKPPKITEKPVPSKRRHIKSVPVEYFNGSIPVPRDMSHDSLDYEVETVLGRRLGTGDKYYQPHMVPLVGMTKPMSRKSKNSKNNKKPNIKKEQKNYKNNDKKNKKKNSKEMDLLKEIWLRRFLRDSRNLRERRCNPRYILEDRRQQLPLSRIPPYYYDRHGIRRSTANAFHNPYEVKTEKRSSRQADIIRVPVRPRPVPRMSKSVPDIAGYIDSIPRRKYPLNPNVIINRANGDILHSSVDLTPLGQERRASMNNSYSRDRPSIANGPYVVQCDGMVPDSRYHTISARPSRGHFGSKAEWI